MTTPIHRPVASSRPHLVFIFSDQQHHAAWRRRHPAAARPAGPRTAPTRRNLPARVRRAKRLGPDTV